MESFIYPEVNDSQRDTYWGSYLSHTCQRSWGQSSMVVLYEYFSVDKIYGRKYLPIFSDLVVWGGDGGRLMDSDMGMGLYGEGKVSVIICGYFCMGFSIYELG